MTEKRLADKLLFKPGRKIVLINPPENYHAQLGLIPAEVQLLAHLEKPVDIIQAFITSRQELEDWLPRIKSSLAPGGILWVTYYKGTSKIKTDINRDTINAYAQTIGLQGVAMIAVDDDWSALRLKQV